MQNYYQVNWQHTYPFSFGEFLLLNNDSDSNNIQEELFNIYINTSGFPFISRFLDEPEVIAQYLKDIYSSVLIKDVVKS